MARLHISILCMVIVTEGYRCSSVAVAGERPIADVNVSAKCHIALDQENWSAGQVVRFYAYVTDTKQESIRIVSLPDLGCMVEVDSVWHRFVDSQWVDGLGSDIPANPVAQQGGYLTVMLYPHHWSSTLGGKLLTLTPGEHSIRFAWAEGGGLAPLALVSEAARIRVEGPVSTDANDRAREVEDLFLTFIGRRPPTDPEVRTVLKWDLIRLGWMPKLNWADIPVLLKLAENGGPLRGTVPSRPYVSRPVAECPEGMVALWLIEGLRLRQLSFSHDHKTADKVYYPSLPSQPVCERAGTPIWQTENDPAVHQTVRNAYQQWWKKMESLPTDQVAAIDPLESTDMAWSGTSRR
jgi:hypothetical protein